jgi:hypothetical protein
MKTTTPASSAFSWKRTREFVPIRSPWALINRCRPPGMQN